MTYKSLFLIRLRIIAFSKLLNNLIQDFELMKCGLQGKRDCWVFGFDAEGCSRLRNDLV